MLWAARPLSCLPGIPGTNLGGPVIDFGRQSREQRGDRGVSPSPLAIMQRVPRIGQELVNVESLAVARERRRQGAKTPPGGPGYWHSLTTLARYCRVRSYLVTSRNHGIRPIDAILTGWQWLPSPAVSA
jgi:hypothetical protein